MYHLFMQEREPFMKRYHQRSNIESAYSMIKGKFGSSLCSKSDTGQINEALCKVLLKCFAGCTLEDVVAAINLEVGDLFERANGQDGGGVLYLRKRLEQ
jgi:hypothetical protein